MILLSGGALYCFGRGLTRLLRENPELGWRRVEGKVISSAVDSSDESISAKIVYTYTVDGAGFRGSKIAPLEVWSSFSSSASRFVRKYPAGLDVIVFVDRKHPGRAVLEPQQQPIAAVSVFLIGVVLGLFAWLWWMENLSSAR